MCSLRTLLVGDLPFGGRVGESSEEAVLPQVETWLGFKFKGMSSLLSLIFI